MITFVCGQLCSGKSSYAKRLKCDIFIEVSDIVRDLKNSEDRKVLQDSKDLASKIVEHIASHDLIYNDVVVSGARQKEILESFSAADLIWVHCPTEVRKIRFSNRARRGDNQTFEEAEQGDIDLGILEVKQYIFNKQ